MIVSSAALRGDPNNGSGETKNKELKKKKIGCLGISITDQHFFPHY